MIHAILLLLSGFVLWMGSDLMGHRTIYLYVLHCRLPGYIDMLVSVEQYQIYHAVIHDLVFDALALSLDTTDI